MELEGRGRSLSESMELGSGYRTHSRFLETFSITGHRTAESMSVVEQQRNRIFLDSMVAVTSVVV